MLLTAGRTSSIACPGGPAGHSRLAPPVVVLKGRRRGGGGRGGLAHDVSYDSLFFRAVRLAIGPFYWWFYGPLYLAVNCSTLSVLEEYITSSTRKLRFFLELTSGFVPFLRYAWFDSGYIMRQSTRRSRRLREIGLFLGDHFWMYSRIQRYLVRQWIHVGVSL